MLVRLARPYKSRTALAIVTLVGYTLVALLPPYLAKVAVDDGIVPGDLDALTVVVAVFLAAGIAAFALSGAQTYYTGWVGERALADLRIQLFDHLQRLSLGYYERNRTGAIISRITNDVEALDQLTDGISSLVQNSPCSWERRSSCSFSTGGRARDPRRPSVHGRGDGVVSLTLEPRVQTRARAARARDGDARRGHLGDARRPVVHAEPTSQVTFRGVNERYREANYETVVLSGVYFPAVEVLSAIATAIVLGVGGALVMHESVEIGTLLAFTLYLANFFDPVQQLSQLYNTFLAATAALDRITVVFDEEPEVVDAPAARELPEIRGHVRFENVRFGYGGLPDVLHSFDLDVRPATTVALVGHTGAGKSTIAKLPRGSTTLARGASPSTVTTSARSRRNRCEGSSASSRRRASVRRHDRRQHRVRPPASDARRDRGRGRSRRRRQIREGAALGVRHRRR